MQEPSPIRSVACPSCGANAGDPCRPTVYPGSHTPINRKKKAAYHLPRRNEYARSTRGDA